MITACCRWCGENKVLLIFLHLFFILKREKENPNKLTSNRIFGLVSKTKRRKDKYQSLGKGIHLSGFFRNCIIPINP